jgi:NADH-quinone oxidoreductase subunit J
MTVFNTLFYLIAALIVVSTGIAVTRRNLVHAVIYLILSFFGSAFLFYLFGAPFLAALMVIVYAGAIMVLFLFIIMMLRPEGPGEPLFPARQLWPAAALAAAYLVAGALMGTLDPTTAAAPLTAAWSTPAAFGVYVFRNAWLAVEIASLLLLVALIGALLIGRRSGREHAGETEAP